jgi:hypothetical protein
MLKFGPQCFLCDGTRAVCREHPDRPASGYFACEACWTDPIPCPECDRLTFDVEDTRVGKTKVVNIARTV